MKSMKRSVVLVLCVCVCVCVCVCEENTMKHSLLINMLDSSDPPSTNGWTSHIYTAVVTAKPGVKKWSRGQVVFSVSVKRSKTSFKLS